MKTLDQLDAKLEKRIPISSLPFTISQSGSYYLTDNLTGVSGQNGITISADYVSVDLNGFTLTGVAGAVTGIVVTGAAKAIRVHNGTLAQWPQNGIALGNTISGEIDHVQAIGNHSIAIHAPFSATLSHCTIAQGLSNGLVTGDHSLIEHCLFTNNAAGALTGVDSRVQDCNFSKNNGYGVTVGAGSSVNDSTANENSQHGIVAGDGSTVTNCTAQSNAADGIHMGSSCSVTHCSSTQNGIGTNGSGILTDIRASISGCTAIGNKGDGIVFSGDSLVSHNHASTNGGAGFHDVGSASRIDGNISRENIGTGIFASTGDTVVRNNSGANGNNTADNQYGPTAGANWGPVGTANSATSPWANF
jgi:hypothetical protein